jgi:hypothetical protein
MVSDERQNEARPFHSGGKPPACYEGYGNDLSEIGPFDSTRYDSPFKRGSSSCVSFVILKILLKTSELIVQDRVEL